MAPVAPLGKNGALALLRAGKLPFSFGSPHPWVAILEQDGVFRVRELVVYFSEANAIADASMAAGRGWTGRQDLAGARDLHGSGCQDQAADGVALEPDARERPTGRPRPRQVYSSTG